MITSNINYSEISITLIKELLKYDNHMTKADFDELTLNKRVKYVIATEDNIYEIHLMDNSKINVIIGE